jgi:mannose-1-phosphate guanylyltransferase/phosphomannomutase
VIERAIILVDELGRGRHPAGPEDIPAFRAIEGRPAIVGLVEHLVDSGINELLLVIHQVPGLIAHFFGDGSSMGVRVTYGYQQNRSDTGRALAEASEFANGQTVLVAPGTIRTEIQVSDFVEHHRSYGGDVTVALTEIGSAGQSGRPAVTIDEDSRIAAYDRTGEPPDARWRDTGVFIIQPDLIERLSRAEAADWSRETMPALIAEGNVFGWPSPAVFSTVLEHSL